MQASSDGIAKELLRWNEKFVSCGGRAGKNNALSTEVEIS
jgi:hypothetical protein